MEIKQNIIFTQKVIWKKEEIREQNQETFYLIRNFSTDEDQII
jgi:hypothetical protein